MSAVFAMNNVNVVTVKNTFVEIQICKEDAPVRRNSSIPPSLRLAREKKAIDSDSGSDSGKSTELCPFSPTNRARSPSESGTDFGSLGDVASLGDLSDVSGTCRMYPGMAATQAFFMVGAMMPALVPVPPVEGKQKLNTAARAWTPSATATPQASGSFWPQCHTLVMVAKTALERSSHQSGVPMHVVVGETPHGYVLNINVDPSVLNYQSVLSHAKESLLFAAEKSKNVYVMGYKAKPFMQTPGGFGAVLCGMEDESTACWSFYEWGSCKRGNMCKWCHPTSKANIDVVLQLC